MDNVGILINQAAAEVGVTPQKARLAIYLTQLSEAGRTTEDAARLLRCTKGTVEKKCREFMIDFVDYRPFAKLEKAGKSRPEPKFAIRTKAVA